MLAFLTTVSGQDRHRHVAVVDDDDNGVTTTEGERPHRHDVVDAKILPANGHTHQIVANTGQEVDLD